MMMIPSAETDDMTLSVISDAKPIIYIFKHILVVLGGTNDSLFTTPSQYGLYSNSVLLPVEGAICNEQTGIFHLLFI